MQQVSTRAELEQIVAAWKAEGLRVGFVPTMGALHEGHLSLVKRALEKADRAVVSIFVNPTQFAPHEDFDSYPRTEKADIEKLEQAGAHLVYVPLVKEMYPEGLGSAIKAGAEAQGLESDFRPHFFDGVVNVVARLFAHVQPHIAVFGEKDYQQLRVIADMVKSRTMPIEIIGGEIVRDAYGLALSSRNAYLSAEELETARQLNKTLFALAGAVKSSPDHAGALIEKAKQDLLAAGFDKIDYIEQRWSRLLAAVWLGKTRLIDNVPL